MGSEAQLASLSQYNLYAGCFATHIGMNIDAMFILGLTVYNVQLIHMCVPGCLPKVQLAA